MDHLNAMGQREPKAAQISPHEATHQPTHPFYLLKETRGEQKKNRRRRENFRGSTKGGQKTPQGIKNLVFKQSQLSPNQVPTEKR